MSSTSEQNDFNPEQFQITDIPQSVFADTHDQIRRFTTCFIVDGRLAGSGTFVVLNQAAGILTASHVWTNVRDLAQKNHTVGILISDQRHVFTIPLTHLNAWLNLPRRTDEFGPDLEFVELPSARLGDIRARRSFFNLSIRPAERHAVAQNEFGVLMISGFPAERVSHVERPEVGRIATKFFNLGSVVGKDRVVLRDGYDYLEMETAPNDPPTDYRGLSGASVWKVIMGKEVGTDPNTSKVIDYQLSGVVFYQSEVKENARFLRAHGPASIYEVVPRLFAAGDASSRRS
jgi:hypothetical protein